MGCCKFVVSDVLARIKYAKREPANFIGHLDTIQALKRSMRQALLPVKWTAGYNPKIKLSSSPPLRLGFLSEAEYIDVALTAQPGDYQIDAFKKNCIEGIVIKEIKFLSADSPAINEVILGFRYKIEGGNFNSNLENIVTKGVNFVVIDVYKKNGNIPNPLKIIGEGNYEVKKIGCLMVDGALQ